MSISSLFLFLTGGSEPLKRPLLFWGFTFLSTTVLLCAITAMWFLGKEVSELFTFREGGLITAFSSISLTMAAAMSLAIFYMKIENWSLGTLFWLVLAAGSIFLSLDEQLEFHERGSDIINVTSIGESESFRSWNDLIVIFYGVVALSIALMFGKEVLKCRIFAFMFAAGFAFYAIHTGIDTLVPSSVAWKDGPEETAKVLSVYSIFLATFGKFMALTDKKS